MLNGVGDVKLRPPADTPATSAALLPRQDSSGDMDTDPFFDDVPKKDTALYVFLLSFLKGHSTQN